MTDYTKQVKDVLANPGGFEVPESESDRYNLAFSVSNEAREDNLAVIELIADRLQGDPGWALMNRAHYLLSMGSYREVHEKTLAVIHGVNKL